MRTEKTFLEKLSRRRRNNLFWWEHIIVWLVSRVAGPRPWYDEHYDGEWCECPADWFRGGQSHPKRRPPMATGVVSLEEISNQRGKIWKDEIKKRTPCN